MQNIIEIEEKGNRLYLLKTYKPIICGNTNYFIKFSFSEDWNKCVKKTAYFVVEGKKIPIEFEGDICNIPAMPNLGSFLLFLVASPSDKEILSSTSIRLNLERNPAMDKLKKTEPFKSYYTTLLGAINRVERGQIKIAEAEFAKKAEAADFANNAKIAEKSQSQVSLTGNEDVYGEKNFIDGIKINGSNAICQKNISNSNLLINGDFKINQRRQTKYSAVGSYTVDRWKLESGTVEVKDNGIVLNGTITQTFENAPTGTLTASADQSNGEVSASYENGVFTISAESVLIGWAKLEVGSIATQFTPKTTAEELIDCYRYYYRTTASGAYGRLLNNGMFRSATSAMFTLNLPTPMRISPTINKSGAMIIIGCYGVNSGNIKGLSVNYFSDKCFLAINATVDAVSKKLEFTSCLLQASNSDGAYIELDAEIY